MRLSSQVVFKALRRAFACLVRGSAVIIIIIYYYYFLTINIIFGLQICLPTAIIPTLDAEFLSHLVARDLSHLLHETFRTTTISQDRRGRYVVMMIVSHLRGSQDVETWIVPAPVGGLRWWATNAELLMMVCLKGHPNGVGRLIFRLLLLSLLYLLI